MDRRAGLGEGISIPISTIETIVLIMATTITVDEKTKDRLTDYKFGNWTYDEVLNMLMDKVSIKGISSEHIEEHYRRMKYFKGVSKEDFKKELKKRFKKGS